MSKNGEGWAVNWKRLLLAGLFVLELAWVDPSRAAAAARPGQAKKAKAAKAQAAAPGAAQNSAHTLESLRLAIEDLARTFPGRYPRGAEFLDRLEALRRRAANTDFQNPQFTAELVKLRREALLANPLLDFDRLLLLKRQSGQLGLPTNHQCNTCLPQRGYDNEIAILEPVRPAGTLRTLYRPAEDFFVGEMDLDFSARRLLFSQPNGRSFQIHEIGIDGTGLRQVSREDEGVDNFDPCYLPDGRIVFASTAAFTGVPCWHGKERACCLYLMNADGSGMRQLGFDQDLDLHPSVLDNGQVIYSRWDYTGIMHAYVRPLMVMNPDGSLQRAIYGSNDYYPNCLFFPRAVPGAPTRLAAILAGYHGANRSGELVVLDTAKGSREAEGILHRIGHRGEPIVPEIRDNLTGNHFPQYLHPWPLSGKYLITAMKPNKKGPWGIYLVDAFDNVQPLMVDPKFDFFEPIPLRPRVKPPVIPDRVDLARDDATVYLHNVYAGPGLAGVPRGAVRRLRVVAYNFGYPGLAGPDMIGHAGPWDAMRILGTVPVNEDGSAFFRIPAATPISVQPLDAEGKALALMRSWYTAMPGESASCVGCHERPGETPPARRAAAASRPPVEITPWHGPARGFDFEREVQPVLDKYCIGCHNGQARADGRTIPDLRAARFAAHYEGLPLSQLGASRLDPALRERRDLFALNTPDHPLLGDRKMKYTPAYDVLNQFVRRVNVEDDVNLQPAGELHADTSPLIQLLQAGHHGVRLDAEAWDRLITWIDLNGPCHGTWRDIAPIPGAADRRRRELALKYGGPREDPEQVYDLPRWTGAPILPAPVPVEIADAAAGSRVTAAGWPFDGAEARRRQQAQGHWEKTVDLGGSVTLRLVRIPAGEFVMGEAGGAADVLAPRREAIARDFWIGACEITNAQFKRLLPGHGSGYFMKRSLTQDGPGIDLNDPLQPAVRVSWEQAMEYCRKLSEQTGLRFTLPSEAEWEYACRAGTAGAMNYGEVDTDFSALANMADASFARIYAGSAGLVVLQEYPHVAGVDDLGLATMKVGSYRPNAWGLFDMHGNAAEWTRTSERLGESSDDANAAERRIVRGGSFHDLPKRCRSAWRVSYPAWMRVHDVGFRVVVEQ